MYWRLLECLIWEFISLSDLWNTEAFPLPPRRGRPQVHFQDVQDFVVREFEQHLDKSLLTKVGLQNLAQLGLVVKWGEVSNGDGHPYRIVVNIAITRNP